jgi:hypothetical protein
LVAVAAVAGNRNRKGYYGMVALSAVDVWLDFVILNSNGLDLNDNVAITSSSPSLQ